MRRDELTGVLRQDYDDQRGYGTLKVDDPEYQNIWFVVPPPPPRELPRNLPLAALARANATLTRLPSFSEMSELDRLINYFFVRKEAIESSRMEGTWSTIDNLLSPPGAFDSDEGKSEHQSVRGYAHALEKQFTKALNQKERIFTEEVLCEIHKDIVSKDPSFNGTPGSLREPGKPRSIVQIGRTQRKEESTYNPAPPQYVRACLKNVLQWLSDEDLAQRGDAGVAGFTLAVRLAIGHAHFEAVHPFSDGNGRVGRALWPLQMICSDRMPLYLSGYVAEQKEAYGWALQEAQKKLDYSPIIEFVCEAVIQSESESKLTRAAIESLPAKWKERASFRAGSASLLALEVLQKRPIITSAVLMESLKVSKQVASKAIDQLLERKIVRERGKIGRSNVYAAEELIALLSRPFGSDVKQALASGYKAIQNG